VGTGHVWLESDEATAMAAELDLAPKAFSDRFLVQVDGRISLHEKNNGACVLLEGSCGCTVYESRPQQCRDFPDWQALHHDDDALGRAASYCPGIQRLPEPAVLHQAMDSLRELYRELDAAAEAVIKEGPPAPAPAESTDGRAPCLTSEGLRLASSLEADFFLVQFGSTVTDLAGDCPALQSELCTATDSRPLICRKLSPKRLLHAQQSLQDRASFSGYPWSRAEWSRILADRRAAWLQLTDRTSPFDV
jgi:uncharacterized protein